MKGLFITFTPQYVRPIVITYEPETEAYLNAISVPNDATVYFGSTAYEILGSEVWTSLDAAVVATKTALGLTLGVNNLSTKFKYLYPTFGGSATPHQYNLVTATADRTFFGGLTHGADGIMGNGTNGYAELGVNWNPTNFPQNSHSFGVNIKTAVNELGIEFAVLSGGQADVLMYGRLASGNIGTRCGGAAGNKLNATTTSLGFKSMSRTSSANYKVFEDGVLLATNTDSSASNSTNFEITEFAGNSAGTIIQYSTKRHTTIFGASVGFNDTEMLDVVTAWTQWDTDLGR